MDYSSIINHARNLFNARRGRYSFFEKRKLALRAPSWFKEYGSPDHTGLMRAFPALMNHGNVVWGKIIQANNQLFESGDDQHPAALIYSFDPGIDTDPEQLAAFGSMMFQLKGQQTDPELQQFADKLEDEHISDCKLPIPAKVTNDIQCFYATTMIYRHHLPNGILSFPFFPLLTCPDRTDMCMILPSKFWPEPFIQDYWLANE